MTDNRDDALAASGNPVDPLLVAVLAAAASVVLGSPVAVHRIMTPGHDEAERWSRAGRKDIMLSHRLRSQR